MRCKGCHYPLTNRGQRAEHRCPECGRAYDPADAGTWELEAMAGRHPLRWVVLVIIIALVLFFIAAFIPVYRSYPVFGSF